MKTDLSEQKMSGPSKLEKISFGLGDFSGNGIFTFVSTYLMFFYTDAAKLDLGAIGVILLAGRTVDAVFSPVMGFIVDRTDTRYGKCRPFIAAGILPVCLMMCALFYSPASFSEQGKVFYAAMIYVLFSLLYAFINVPYSTMLTVLSSRQEDRIVFNLFKNVGANCGGIFVTACTLWLVNELGNSKRQGFMLAAVLFGIIFLCSSLVCAAHVVERVKPGKGQEKNGILRSLKAAKDNRHWLVLCGVQFLSLTYMMVRNQGTLYYTKYYLGQEALSSLFLSIMPLASVAVAFVLPSIARRRGLRFCVRSGNILWCVSMAGTWAAGKNVTAAILFHMTASIGWAMATGMVFVMLSQVIDYSQWKTGVRPQGFLTSMIALVQKLGIACSGYICAFVLKLGGYQAGNAGGAETLFAIRVNFAGLPFLLSAAVIILISFYTLDEQYQEIESDLNRQQEL
ncbi:MFS transporter [Faecalicatena contorta]|uniref:MFS transporter n=1 Tax=Faecalicatena contorta TaxID=39482 RepID=UPI0031E0B7A4